MPRGSRPPLSGSRIVLLFPRLTYLGSGRKEGDLERGETVVATEIELSNEAQSVSRTEKNIFRLAVSPARKFTEPRREKGRGRKQRRPQKGGSSEGARSFWGAKRTSLLGEGMGTAVSVEVVRGVGWEQERRKEGRREGGESRTARCGPTVVSERMMRGGTRGREGGTLGEKEDQTAFIRSSCRAGPTQVSRGHVSLHYALHLQTQTGPD